MEAADSTHSVVARSQTAKAVAVPPALEWRPARVGGAAQRLLQLLRLAQELAGRREPAGPPRKSRRARLQRRSQRARPAARALGRVVPRALPGMEREAAISELVSGLVSEYIGRGPRARTYLNGDVLTVVVEDSLTAGEQRLVRDGMSELVLSTRRAFQRTMREDLIAGVEQLTGSKVRLSANQMEPDITVEVFVLDGSSTGVAPPGGR